MRHPTADERALLDEAVVPAFPIRWASWELSVEADGARVDDEGDVHLPCTLAWSAPEGALLGAEESVRPLLHLADLSDPARTQAYFRALAASVPRVAAYRGLDAEVGASGSTIAELLPASSPLERLTLRTFDQFEGALTRPAWLEGRRDVEPDALDEPAPPPVAVDDDLERELAAWPTDAEPWARYARWLTERGDPRGALIAAHLGAGHEDPARRRHEARVARRLFEEHGRHFLGPFAGRAAPLLAEEVTFDWSTGFIRRVELQLGLDASGPPPLAVLRAALALPSSRFAEELVLSVAPSALDAEARHPLPRWTEALVSSGGHPRLRVLRIVPPDVDRDDVVEGPALLVEPEDLGAVRAAFPSARLADPA